MSAPPATVPAAMNPRLVHLPTLHLRVECLHAGEFACRAFYGLSDALKKEGIEFSPHQDMDFSSGERKQTWGVIAHLKTAGFRQALLTNDATAWLGESWWEKWPYVHLFEQVVDVKTVGVRKPAPEPYLACVKALHCEPQECLFIDDMHANCRGAEAVGMDSFWFDICDPEGSMKKLLSYLGVAPV